MVRAHREVCGLDLSAFDTGDGAAAGEILVLEAVIVLMAFWAQFRFYPLLLVHAVLWPVVTVPMAILLMRPAKAALVTLKLRHRASEMGLWGLRARSGRVSELRGRFEAQYGVCTERDDRLVCTPDIVVEDCDPAAECAFVRLVHIKPVRTRAR